MAGFRTHLEELQSLGAQVVAASVDPLDKAKIVADEVRFPIGYGVGRATAAALGSWWEDRRAIIQPSEFMLNPEGKVVVSSYSDGPLGRFDAADVVRLIRFYDSRK